MKRAAEALKSTLVVVAVYAVAASPSLITGPM